MRSNRFFLFAVSGICILGFALSAISESLTVIVNGSAAIFGAIFGAKYAGQIGRNKLLWGLLCLIMPYLFPIVLAILNPKDSVAFNYSSSMNKKALRNIVMGLFWLIFGGIVLRINIEDENILYIIFSTVAILSGIAQFISGISNISSIKLDKESAKYVAERVTSVNLTNANDYPELNEAKEFLKKGDISNAFKLTVEELKQVHKRNKDIYKELTANFLELLKSLYSKKEIAFSFNDPAYNSLVMEYRNNIDKLLTFIDKYGYERVMIDSPNFGANLPDKTISELKELFSRNINIDKEIDLLFKDLHVL